MFISTWYDLSGHIFHSTINLVQHKHQVLTTSLLTEFRARLIYRPSKSMIFEKFPSPEELNKSLLVDIEVELFSIIVFSQSHIFTVGAKHNLRLVEWLKYQQLLFRQNMFLKYQKKFVFQKQLDDVFVIINKNLRKKKLDVYSFSPNDLVTCLLPLSF